MGIIRPVRFVGPEEAAASLLRSFVDEHVHMAIVREGERTVGLVTFEDLVEELVGELEDEFDRLPRMLHTLAGNVLMIGGGIPAAEVLARLGLPADGVRGTLSSWLADRIPAPPVTGARHREDGYDFAVRRTRRGRVFEVAVTPVRAAPAPDAAV
jgi:putative hemolysin